MNLTKFIVLFLLLCLLTSSNCKTTVLVNRLSTGDEIYGTDKDVCLKNIRNTIWVNGDSNQGSCFCRERYPTYYSSQCLSSQQISNECTLHLRHPFHKVPVMEKVTTKIRHYFKINFETMYNLNTKDRFTTCHINTTSMRNNRWEKLQAIVKLKSKDMRTIMVVPFHKSLLLDGHLLRLSFVCDGQFVGCVILKTEGFTEVPFVLMEDSTSLVKRNASSFRNKTDGKQSNKTDQAPHKEFFEKDIFEDLSKLRMFLKPNLTTPTLTITTKTREKTKPERAKKIFSTTLNPKSFTSSTLISKSDIAKENDTRIIYKVVKRDGAFVSVNIALAVISGLIMSLVCVLLFICDRVYRVRKEDEILPPKEDLVRPKYIRLPSVEEADDNNDDLFLPRKSSLGKKDVHIPRIVIETPEEEFVAFDDFAIPPDEFKRRERKVSPFSSLRLSRDMSSKVKSSLKKRLSLLDSLEKNKPDVEEQKPVATPPLYKKVKRKITQ